MATPLWPLALAPPLQPQTMTDSKPIPDVSQPSHQTLHCSWLCFHDCPCFLIHRHHCFHQPFFNPSFLSAHLTTSLGSLSNTFSRSTNAKNSGLFFARNFSCICRTTKMASVVPFPSMNPNCIPWILISLSTFSPKPSPDTFISCSSNFIALAPHTPMDHLFLAYRYKDTELPVSRYLSLIHHHVTDLCHLLHPCLTSCTDHLAQQLRRTTRLPAFHLPYRFLYFRFRYILTCAFNYPTLYNSIPIILYIQYNPSISSSTSPVSQQYIHSHFSSFKQFTTTTSFLCHLLRCLEYRSLPSVLSFSPNIFLSCCWARATTFFAIYFTTTYRYSPTLPPPQ